MKRVFVILIAGVAANLLGLIFAAAQTPTPTASPFPDQSVAWQNNAVHDGNDASSTVVPPLALKWRHDFTPLGVVSISYPLIAQGLIIVTTVVWDNQSSYPAKSLVAFNESTGQQVWSVNITGTYAVADAAYDSGKVFVVNFDGLLQAFDAATGNPLWSVTLPGQYDFTAPPAAVNGTIFLAGVGEGATLYAVNETNGSAVWTANLFSGIRSSPAVTLTHVFVSLDYPASAFNPVTGQLQWNYSGASGGGDGSAPVFHLGKLYVHDPSVGSTDGLIIDADNGANVGSFASDRLPAFIDNLAVYSSSGTLTGVDIPTGQVLWSFAGDGGLNSAPLIANGTIYIGSTSGLLYGLDLQGKQIWSTQVGAPIPAPDEQNATLTTGLGAGDGLLVVPTSSTLNVYVSSGITNISTRGTVETGDNVLIGGFVISGAQPKNIVLRAIGPSLARYGVANALANPFLELHDSHGALITANDDWGNAPNKQAIINSGFAPPNYFESAILTTLNPGSYTAIVRGVSGDTGVALVEAYDLDHAIGSQFINISTRDYVGTGDNVMIAGISVAAENQTVIIRALGPTLSHFGVPNVLADPTLELHNSNGTLIQYNDNWKDTQQGAIQGSGYAPPSDLESAILTTLAPATYTAIVRGKNNATGNALVEVYSLN
ncbi:MAG: PQQ-binding-like beta-propeller repeat protein [Verrucomicrobia bacterium]|nr:PQQ-binding-like beta-propeller repeat protein [Verrucomicrobiota bacterium]